MHLLGLVALIACPLLGDESGVRWYKGNTHTHTLWSDGNDFPETAADWYKKNGYHFLVLSDHNVLQRGERWKDVTKHERENQVVSKHLKRWGEGKLALRKEGSKTLAKLMTLEEIRRDFEEEGKFIMIEGFEGYNGRISDMNWSYQGTKNILLPFYNHNDMQLATDLEEKDGYQWWRQSQWSALWMDHARALLQHEDENREAWEAVTRWPVDSHYAINLLYKMRLPFSAAKGTTAVAWEMSNRPLTAHEEAEKCSWHSIELHAHSPQAPNTHANRTRPPTSASRSRGARPDRGRARAAAPPRSARESPSPT